MLRAGHDRAVFTEAPPSFGDWGNLLTTLGTSSPAIEALLITLQLAAAGAAIALVVATVLSLLSRWRAFRDLLRLSVVPLVSLLAPVTALMSYWLALKLGIAPTAAFEGLKAGLDSAVTNGWLPSVVLAITMLPGLTALLSRKAPALAELGWASGAAQLASRSAPHGQWTLGLPAGATVLGLAVVESMFAPSGLFGRFATALAPVDSELALVIIFLVSAAGALLSIDVDLLGRSVPKASTHEFAGLRPPTDGRMAAFGFAFGMVGLAALLLAALIGGSLDAGVSALADPLSSPLSNGYLLGSDADGRDLLNLALAATGSAVPRSLIPAAIASVAGAALAALAYYLERAGRPTLAQLVPGAAVDLLWWPAPLFGLLVIAVWGVGDELQLLTSAVLLPVAYRLCRREVLGAPVGAGRRFGGVIALMAAAAFAIDTVLGFIGASSFAIDGNWGTQLASSSETLDSSVWPALVPSMAIVLFAFVLNLAGSYLIASGWSAWLASPEARRAAAEARDAASATAATPPVPADEPDAPSEPLSLAAAPEPNDDVHEDESEGTTDEDDHQGEDRNGTTDSPRPLPDPGSIRPPAFPGTPGSPLDRPMRQPSATQSSRRPRPRPLTTKAPDRLLSPPPLVPGSNPPTSPARPAAKQNTPDR